MPNQINGRSKDHVPGIITLDPETMLPTAKCFCVEEKNSNNDLVFCF